MSASTMELKTQTGRADVTQDAFNLDVTLLEQADPAGLVNMTNDNCGSTCGACVSSAG